MQMLRWGGRGAAAAVLAGVVLAGCAGGSTTSSSGSDGCSSLHMVVTTSVLGDVVERVALAGDQVEVLMPVGSDPHTFEASARQVAAMHTADLVVVNGLGLEAGLSSVIEAARSDGVNVVEAASFVTPEPLAGGEAGGSASLDPHIWMDPVRMEEVTTGLAEAMAAADPACAAERRAAGEAYRQELVGLDAEMRAILAVVPEADRKLVTNHDAFGYLAARYGFQVIGVIIPGGTTFAEPSPSDLATLVDILRREGVRAVFAETIESTRLADALAAELGQGVKVVTLYTGSLGAPGSGADTYVGMMRTNATLIAQALAGP
jgi:zinc/manganese transport system substrate-binding protein